jgi:hypothetical protein
MSDRDPTPHRERSRFPVRISSWAYPIWAMTPGERERYKSTTEANSVAASEGEHGAAAVLASALDAYAPPLMSYLSKRSASRSQRQRLHDRSTRGGRGRSAPSHVASANCWILNARYAVMGRRREGIECSKWRASIE